jgi:hypothetical protein
LINKKEGTEKESNSVKEKNGSIHPRQPMKINFKFQGIFEKKLRGTTVGPKFQFKN